MEEYIIMKLNFKEGKGDKIHVLVDGEYYFTVDRTYFAVMGIYQGKEVSREELALLGENAEQKLNICFWSNFDYFRTSSLFSITNADFI